MSLSRSHKMPFLTFFFATLVKNFFIWLLDKFDFATLPRLCLKLRRSLIHTDWDWTYGGIIKIGLNLNIGLWENIDRDYRLAVLFPFWFPFYGKYHSEHAFGSVQSLVYPVFEVGMFRKNNKKYFKFVFKIWRREFVHEPFGMPTKEALEIIGNQFYKMRDITYALWSLKRHGWSTDKIVERLNGNEEKLRL